MRFILMKKILAVLMAAALVVLCAACGSSAPAASSNVPSSTDSSASSSTGAPAGESAKLSVGTGGTTGTYYAYTNVVGTTISEVTGYSFNVLSTGGSVANINGLADGDYNMAIVQNDTMIKAYNALDDNFPTAITNFSVMGEVYSEVVQIVVKGDLKDKVKTLADLKGLRVSIGDAGSGVEANAKALLAAYGLDAAKDITVQNLSVGNSADAMKDGKLDAFFFTSGAPTTAITELATAMDVYLLSIDDKVMSDFIAKNMVGGFEVYAKTNITNSQYAFIPADAPVTTIGVTATYIVDNSLSEEVVYNMTKALWEGQETIAKGHAVGSGMDIKNAFVTIGNVPMHPGAQKYYTEMGIQ